MSTTDNAEASSSSDQSTNSGQEQQFSSNRFNPEWASLGRKNLWRAVLSQVLRDLCDSSPSIQREARSWALHKKNNEDREMCCELAGVSSDAFVAFTKSFLASFETGGRDAILNAARYLYSGLKSTDAESNFLTSPEGFADDSEISDGISIAETPDQ